MAKIVYYVRMPDAAASMRLMEFHAREAADSATMGDVPMLRTYLRFALAYANATCEGASRGRVLRLFNMLRAIEARLYPATVRRERLERKARREARKAARALVAGKSAIVHKVAAQMGWKVIDVAMAR